MEGWGADGGEGKPVKVNYRNPFLLAIWSGRGARPPYWVKRIMDERGWTLGEFKQSGEYDVRGQKIALTRPTTCNTWLRVCDVSQRGAYLDFLCAARKFELSDTGVGTVP